MAQNTDQVYKTSDQIVSDLVTKLQAMISDANTGSDSIFRMWMELYANTAEGLYLQMQLTHDDMFIQTASAIALNRLGEMFGRPRKLGTVATGSVRFSGAGGTFIESGTTVSAPRPSLGDSLDFQTTADATVPNPGIPDPPTTADNGAGGSLAAGTYEYGVTFVTAEGETEIGDPSVALTLAVNHNAHVTNISLGGPGTTSRNLYERVNGGAWQKVTDAGTVAALNDNVTTAVVIGAGTRGGAPPATSTAERVTVAVQATDVGAQYNVAVGAITDLSSSAADLTDVTNIAATSGGTDDEDIEVFRGELLKWVRAPMSGSPDDLVAWATSIDGVESATVYKNVDLSGAAAPGTVSVRISGPGGAIPDAATVTAVLNELESHDLANATILVDTFVATPVAAALTITPSAGYTLADVTPSIQQAFEDYINSIPVGGTVYRAGIYHAIFGLVGVDTLAVTTPSADVTMTSTEKATPGTLTLS